MSKKADAEITALLEQQGAVKLPEPYVGYTHTLDTKIGPAYLRVDTGGKLRSIFGNFLGNEVEAKEAFGHWKVNVHWAKTNDSSEEQRIVTQHVNKLTFKLESS